MILHSYDLKKYAEPWKTISNLRFLLIQVPDLPAPLNISVSETYLDHTIQDALLVMSETTRQTFINNIMQNCHNSVSQALPKLRRCTIVWGRIEDKHGDNARAFHFVVGQDDVCVQSVINSSSWDDAEELSDTQDNADPSAYLHNQ